MAEGFARHLVKDKSFTLASAGLIPSQLNPMAVQVMAEVGIDISNQTSNLLSDFNPQDYDIVASMCGCEQDLPDEWLMKKDFHVWRVDDPESGSIEIFRQVRDQVKMQVETLLTFLSGKLN